MTNWQVAQAWRDSRKARSGHMQTDGRAVFSYALRIGLTVGGEKIALNYAATGGHFYSNTTSHHVALVCRVASHIFAPADWQQWAGYWGLDSRTGT